MRKIALWAIGILALGGLMASKTADALPIEYAFSSTVGASIVFDADGTGNFRFEDGTNGHDFQITLQNGGNGDLLGLFGNIDGNFVIDDPAGGTSTAVTSTNGTFSIADNGNLFEADIDLINISADGPGGTLTGTIFYSGATYAGANADLQALTTAMDGPGSITFQLSGGTLSLDNLYSSTSPQSFSYSGATTAVPEPVTIALLGVGLAGVGFAMRRRRDDKIAA